MNKIAEESHWMKALHLGRGLILYCSYLANPVNPVDDPEYAYGTVQLNNQRNPFAVLNDLHWRAHSAFQQANFHDFDLRIQNSRKDQRSASEGQKRGQHRPNHVCR